MVYGETFLRNFKFYAKTLTKLHDVAVVTCGVAEPHHFEKFNPDPHQSQKQDL